MLQLLLLLSMMALPAEPSPVCSEGVVKYNVLAQVGENNVI